MRKRIIMCITVLALCAGLRLEFSCVARPDGSNDDYVQLDDADADIRITRSITDAEAVVSAMIIDAAGHPVVLQDGQAVSVNTRALLGPDADGEYSRTVAAANEYKITVSEPTRGVQETTVASPAAFEITSPPADGTASLAGFALTWSNVDPSLKVTIDFRQVLLGQQKSQSFALAEDTGTATFTAADLADFQQGANIQIKVTKVREHAGIAGFNTATATVALSHTVSVVPGP